MLLVEVGSFLALRIALVFILLKKQSLMNEKYHTNMYLLH